MTIIGERAKGFAPDFQAFSRLDIHLLGAIDLDDPLLPGSLLRHLAAFLSPYTRMCTLSAIVPCLHYFRSIPRMY